MKYFFKGLKEGFKDFGHNIPLIINSILLTIVYLLGVGLTSIIAKIFGKKFLDKKIDRNAKTYWTELNIKTKSADKYGRQF